MRLNLALVVEDVMLEDVAILPPFPKWLPMLSATFKERASRFTNVDSRSVLLHLQLVLLLACLRVADEARVLVG